MIEAFPRETSQIEIQAAVQLKDLQPELQVTPVNIVRRYSDRHSGGVKGKRHGILATETGTEMAWSMGMSS
jgi:hypothetical protein